MINRIKGFSQVKENSSSLASRAWEGDQTKWYWTKWYGQNGTDKMVAIFIDSNST